MGKIADELSRRWGVPYAEMEKLGLTDSAEAVLTERVRQVEEEGCSTHHDDEVHNSGDLADAAACYAIAGGGTTMFGSVVLDVTITGDCVWRWDLAHWKPSTHWDNTTAKLRNLEKAGALILAEMDRLHRQQERG